MQWKIGDRIRSGARCPLAGYWSIAGRSGSSIRFAIGETMPLHDGKKADWILTCLN